jgi:MFS family permease
MSRQTRTLGFREFRILWIASIASHLGSFLNTVATSWLMLELTGSPLWVGAMVAAPTLPLLVVAMPAGALADLVDRRKVMLASHVLMGAGAAAMTLLWYAGRITPGLLLGLGIAMGLGQSLNLPSWQATVSDLVPSNHVASAVALNSAAFNVARSVGPALGGVLVAAFGPGPAFAINGLSYLPVIGAVARLHRPRLDNAGESMGEAIAEGLRYARHTPAYRWVLLVASVFALTSAVVQAALPTLTAEVLGGGASDYGLLLGAMGVGALAGAWSRGWGTRVLGRRLVPSAIGAFGVAGVMLALAPGLGPAVVALVVTGLLWVWILSTLNATTQLLSPGWVRGRIMSLYTLSYVGILPIGSIMAGALAEAFGAPAAILALSCGSIALGLVATRVPLPVLGEVRPPIAPAGWEPPPHPIAVDADRVMISTTWVIDDADLEEFLAVMDEMRRVRLRTGAFRWRLYRDVGDPHRMTEVFLLNSWEAHLRQHTRIDDEAAAVIGRARSFDRQGGPVTRHLATVDVASGRRPDWDALVAVHENLHRTDGSIPLEPEAHD